MSRRLDARIALTAVLAACVAAPSPSAAPETLVVASPGTTPLASAARSRVSVSWESLAGLEAAIGDGDVLDLVHGPAGWVAAGDCGREFRCPTAWFSSDGRKWSQHRLPTSHLFDEVWDVAAGAGGYVIDALEHDGQQQAHQPQTWVEFWVSKDGKSWQRRGKLRDIEDPFLRGVALAPSGAMVVGRVWDMSRHASGPYVTSDGQAWDLLTPSAFGVESLYVELLTSTSSEVVLIGSPCEQVDMATKSCNPHVWTSTDGSAWRDTGAIHSADGTTIGGALSVASDGRRMVAAGQRCNRTDYCDVWGQIWTSAGGGDWHLVLDQQSLEDGHVVFTGSAFLYIGLNSYIGKPVMLASVDGDTWSAIPADGLPYNDEDCLPWLAAGNDLVVAGNSNLCNWFVGGTIEVDPATTG